MHRTATYIAAAAMGLVAASGQVQADHTADEILLGGPISLTTPTDDGTPTLVDGVGALGELIPFSGEFRFQQTIDLLDPPGGVNEPEHNRLFKHDYSFSIPASASGAPGEANVQDIPNNVSLTMGLPVIDIRQLTLALFTDGGPAGGGTLVDPPGVRQVLNPETRISTLFSGLAAGEYTLRIAGILNGFDENGDWHGEYQGNIAITPLPGAAWFFVSAIGGLIWLRRRRLQAA